MLANLNDEKDPSVWKQVRSCLNSLDEAFKFEGTKVQAGIRNFKKALISPQARALGWDFSSDDISMAKHKAEMFEAAGEAGDSL
jgi:hypothetical protein